jgi:hypothetical protein
MHGHGLGTVSCWPRCIASPLSQAGEHHSTFGSWLQRPSTAGSSGGSCPEDGWKQEIIVLSSRPEGFMRMEVQV